MADERFVRDPWAQLGALAGATYTVQIGICVIGPFMRQRTFTAAAAATLDELSGGRVVLGLGAGGTGFAALWTAAEHPVGCQKSACPVTCGVANGSRTAS